MVNKLNKFQSFVLSSKFDIMWITESWIAPSITDNKILPNDNLILSMSYIVEVY